MLNNKKSKITLFIPILNKKIMTLSLSNTNKNFSIKKINIELFKS